MEADLIATFAHFADFDPDYGADEHEWRDYAPLVFDIGTFTNTMAVGFTEIEG